MLYDFICLANTFKFLNNNLGAVSSVGRASVLQTGGHRFESCIAHHKLCSSVAQLVEHTTVNR